MQEYREGARIIRLWGTIRVHDRRDGYLVEWPDGGRVTFDTEGEVERAVDAWCRVRFAATKVGDVDIVEVERII